MKVNHLPIETAVSYWLRTTGIEGGFDRDLMKMRASDAVAHFTGTEQCKLKLTLLDIDNFEAELPDDFQSLALAVCLREHHQPVKIGQVVQWVYDHPNGGDCDIEINLICPECHKEGCTDHNGIIEIETDKLFQRDNPNMFVNHWKHYTGFSKPITDVDGMVPMSNLDPRFEVMTPMTNEDTLWNADYHLEECVALSLPQLTGGKKYRIDPPKFIADFKKGQVLISYLGYQKQGGYYKMPDYPQAFSAIEHFLDASYFKRRWLKRLEPNVERAYLRSLAQWEQAYPRIRSALNMPDHDSWMAHIQQHMVVSSDEFFYKKTTY